MPLDCPKKHERARLLVTEAERVVGNAARPTHELAGRTFVRAIPFVARIRTVWLAIAAFRRRNAMIPRDVCSVLALEFVRRRTALVGAV